VLGRANGDVWGFTPGCFSKVVGCCVRAAECGWVEVVFVAVVTMFEDFRTTFVYVVSLIVVLALFWCFYLLISEIALC